MHTKTESAIKEKDWKYPSPKKERLLTDLELTALEETMSQHEKERPSSSVTVNAIRFLLYTGCRISELLNLQWADVHLEEGYLDLQDAKGDARVMPLNDKARQILRTLQKQESNPYVFCGKLPGMHLSSLDSTWRKVCILAGIPNVRIHDLRHSYATSL